VPEVVPGGCTVVVRCDTNQFHGKDNCSMAFDLGMGKMQRIVDMW